MIEFNLTYNCNHNVRLIAGKDTVSIDHLPPDGFYAKIIVSLIDSMGKRFDSAPISRSCNGFVIGFQNVSPGKYSMSCFKQGFAFESYNHWFGKIPIFISNDRSVTFEQSPVYGNNIKCLQQIESHPSNITKISESPSWKIRRVAEKITRHCSTTYDAALAVHDYIAQTISYDMDSYNKILNEERIDYMKVSNASMVLESGLGVCAGYANLAVAMFTSVGIPAKTLNCYALGYSTEDNWSKENVQSTCNHVITAVYNKNRWLLMDITWDAVNDYQNGCIKKKRDFRRSYFDPTLPFLSCTHRLLIN